MSWASDILKTAFGTGAGSYLGSQVFHKQNQEMARLNAALEYEKQIISLHGEYSNCVATVLRIQKENQYFAKWFEETQNIALEGKDEEKWKRLNRCRSISKDYWYMVRQWATHYGIPSRDADLYSGRYKLFVDLILPLEQALYKEKYDQSIFTFAIDGYIRKKEESWPERMYKKIFFPYTKE